MALILTGFATAALVSHAQAPLTCQGGAGIDSANCAVVHYHVRMYRPDSKTSVELSGVNRFSSKSACEATTDGGSVYFYLATISNNTTTTYVDTTLDGNLGSTSYPTNHDVPLTTLTIIASACNRLFGVSSANTRRLYASLPDSNFEGWPGTYYWDLPDDIKAIEPLVDRLIIYTDVGVVSFVIPDSTNVDSFYFSEPLSLQTTQSAHAVCRFWNGLAFRGPRGIYFSDGVSAKLITENQESLFGALSTTQKLSATETSLFYIAEPFGMTTEFGTIVRIDSVSDTCVFSAELGVVIDVADSDTYTFSTELGVEIDWGSTDTANQILQVDTDYNNVCHMLSDAAVCMASMI